MKPFFVVLSIITLLSCASKNKIYESSDNLYDFEILDTLFVTSPKVKADSSALPIYRASADRKHDLKNTVLDLKFDWEKQHVIGLAKLTLSSYFYPTDLLILDAKNFIVEDIILNGTSLEYQNTGDKLWITLDRVYSRDEDFIITLEYTAQPNVGSEGGSVAIQSDKGLFFINPHGKEDKPQQIWTQGETEHNSRWFPTIDKPNERCSQEIILTVEDRFKTLSNGKLVSSEINSDGTRTDHWKQELEHAPYLFMLAVGEYAVVEDEWNGLPLYYYVEKDYENDARQIFNHTPEMLSFFSQLLDYDYPWDKYAQVVCRDYISGAMENTGAVIFGEFVQRSIPELLDEPNDYIVAHEMIHHWFGNLVTCESWSNLTLNEGFANYGEYLWFEHKYGSYAAEHNRLSEIQGYLGSGFGSSLHPLIHFKYGDKEQMFDAHSYNKGGLVLHMLRNYLGDDAFFASLNKYLKDNAFSSVEADELRMAFEDVSGKDLNWFFDQWFFNQGHPVVEVNYDLDHEENIVRVHTQQVQNTEFHLPLYQLPVEVALYYEDGSVGFHKHFINDVSSTLEIPVSGKMPLFAVLDGKRDLLAVITENRSIEEQVDVFRYSQEYLDQYTAINKLRFEDEMDDILDLALKHDFFYFRREAVNAIYDEKYIPQLKEILFTDENAVVRNSAFEKLVDFDPEEAILVSQQILKNEKSYYVLGNTLATMYSIAPEETLPEVEKIAQKNPKPFYGIISDVYAASEDVKHLDFFKDNLEKVSVYELWGFAKLYVDLAEYGNSNDLLSTASALNKNILDAGHLKKSLLMYNMGRIYKILAKDASDKTADKVRGMMESVINHEQDKDLADQLRSYLN